MQILPFFSHIKWFEQLKENIPYDPNLNLQNYIPKNLEYNCEVSKQVRTKIKINIIGSIGLININLINNNEFYTYKNATCNKMNLLKDIAGNLN